MNDTTAAPKSDEWVKTLCAVIQKELASINDRSLCSVDTEADLCRRFINPKPQGRSLKSTLRCQLDGASW